MSEDVCIAHVYHNVAELSKNDVVEGGNARRWRWNAARHTNK
jgi:hypothetical protein